MKIIKNNNKVIADNVKMADTFLKRLKGLMFQKDLKSGEGILIKPCNSIHTFFMYIPIHVIFLDENNKVVKIFRNYKKNKIITKIKNAKMVLELSTKTKLDLSVGDKLHIK